MDYLPAEDYTVPSILIIWTFTLYPLLKRKLPIPEWDSVLISFDLELFFLHFSIFLTAVNHSLGGDSQTVFLCARPLENRQIQKY